MCALFNMAETTVTTDQDTVIILIYVASFFGLYDIRRNLDIQYVVVNTNDVVILYYYFVDEDKIQENSCRFINPCTLPSSG